MFDMVDAAGDYYEDFTGQEAPPEFFGDEVPKTEQHEIEPDNTQEQLPQEETVETEESVEIDPYSKEYFEPGTFENSDKELEWYRDRLDSIRQVLDTDSELYANHVQQTTAALMEKASLEIEGFKIMHDALQSDARGFLLQFIPEALAEHGIQPIMSDEEVLARVEQDMVKHFGENYHIRTNHGEMFNPRSFTSQVWAKQQSLMREWDSINNRNREIMTAWNDNIVAKRAEPAQASSQKQESMAAMSPDQLNMVYEEHFKSKGYDQHKFNDFIAQAEQKRLTFDDLERIVKFDDYIKEAYEKGRKAATQTRYNEARKEGTEYSVRQQVPQQQQNTPTVHEEFYNAFANGGIPFY